MTERLDASVVAITIAKRDRLWCRAACEALPTRAMENLLHEFNGLEMAEREREMSVIAPPLGDGK